MEILLHITNLILNILLCIIVCREYRKFSLFTSIMCIILGTAAVTLQTINLFI